MRKVLYLVLCCVFFLNLSTVNIFSAEKNKNKKDQITVKVSSTETKTFENKKEYENAIKNGLQICRENFADISKTEIPNTTNSECGLLVPWNGGAGWNLVNFGEAGGRVDDDYDGPFPLGFTFSFYGNNKTECYIGSNGYVTFNDGFDEYNAAGLPFRDDNAGVKMIAAYMEDLDTRGVGSGLIYYKAEPHRFTVLYNGVGYYNSNFDRLNTFEIILTDGLDPLIGIGKNVGFSYGDMQWASRGAEGSRNATVGINAGNGAFYYQLGRFSYTDGNHPLFYNGQYSTDSNVNWLDFKNNTCSLADGFNIDISKGTSIAVTKPTLNVLLYANQNYQITWNALGTFNIKLEFSSDNGANWQPIATGIQAGNLQYNWSVPQVNSNQCLVKATNISDPTITSTSSVFRIINPFQFVNGNGGERYPISSIQEISWNVLLHAPGLAVTGNTDKAAAKGQGMPYYLLTKLEYSTNGKEGPWTLVSSSIPSDFNSLNTYSVTMPTFVTSQGLFKLTASPSSIEKASNENPNENQDHYDFITYSDSYWSTYTNSSNGQLAVTYPNGGEQLRGGSYYNVSWTRYGGIVPGQIALEYSTNGGQTWTKINTAPLSPALMRYSWQVPKINSNRCYVRIINNLTGREYDRSDNAFTITSATTEQLSNYPNPFNPATKIKFSIDKNEMTSLKVFNSLGQLVTEIVNKQLNAGYYEYEFNASNLPSGIYYYELRSGSRRDINKMMLVK